MTPPYVTALERSRIAVRDVTAGSRRGGAASRPFRPAPQEAAPGWGDAEVPPEGAVLQGAGFLPQVSPVGVPLV